MFLLLVHSVSVFRPPFFGNDTMGEQVSAPNAWHPMHPSNMGPSSNSGLHNLRPPSIPITGDMDMAWAMNAVSIDLVFP